MAAWPYEKPFATDGCHPMPGVRIDNLSQVEHDIRERGILTADPGDPCHPCEGTLAVRHIERAPFCYVVDGRALVDRADAALAKRILDELGDDRVVMTEAAFDFVVLDLPGADAIELNRLLLAKGVASATFDHVMAGQKTKMHEGVDAERADEPTLHTGRGGHQQGRCAKVAVIDTGLAQEAQSNLWFRGVTDYEREVLRYPGEWELGAGGGHGTFVTGVIRQVALDCQVRVYRGLNAQGIGTETVAARAIDRALHWQPDLLNLSFGGYSVDNTPMPLLARAVAEAQARGVVVVASAGNQRNVDEGGTDTGRQPMWPAALPDVVSVAALERSGDQDEPLSANDVLATYSNRFTGCAVAAPGFWRSVFVTGVENHRKESDGHPDHFSGAAQAAGTSFACAAVTGAIARLMCDDGHHRVQDAVNALLAQRTNRVVDGTTIVAVDVWGD